MTCSFRPLAIGLVTLAACSGGGASSGDGGIKTTRPPVDASVDVVRGAPDAAHLVVDSGAAGCLENETVCGGACIVGHDCMHAITVTPPSSRYVFVNGETFLELTMATTSAVKGVRVGGAVVAFQVVDAGHLWIEIPPGSVGPADVAVTMAGTMAGDGGDAAVVTKRALVYAAVPEGTTWTTKLMTSARGGFPGMATTFDNRALVAGGYTIPLVQDCTDTADLFARDAGSSQPSAGTMSTKRWTATATTVLGGTTVVAGACAELTSCPYDSTLIDLFDPKTSAFVPARGKLTIPRSFLRNLRLADGRVLLGSRESPPYDVYDPVADVVTSVSGGMIGLLARLRDGTVLVVPGAGAANSIFDATAGTFTPTGDSLREAPDALVALGNGHVLAIGGSTSTNDGGALSVTTSAVISDFDPTTKKFTPWPVALGTSRTAATTVLGRDGNVYVIGGETGTGTGAVACDSANYPFTLLSTVEVLSPISQSVTPGPTLPQANVSLRSTILFDGSILAGGGTSCGAGADAAVSYPYVYFLEAPPYAPPK